jgi:hypothetical protein
MKLSKSKVEGLRAPDPSGRQRLFWDDDLKGFGVIVSGTTNGKSYVVQGRLKDGRTRRITIGLAMYGTWKNVVSHDRVKIQGARSKALEILGDCGRKRPKSGTEKGSAQSHHP